MLTIFTIPKPFHGHSKLIQTNAIRSWQRLRPACEVILFGDEEGTAEIAAQLGIQHITGIERNEYGTPLVSSIFSLAQERASHNLLCYVNADIILPSDLPATVKRAGEGAFLMIGRRWDLDVSEPIDFSNPQWESRLHARCRREGRLHAVSGIDYFIFPRGLYTTVPPFAIGRSAWDNWLVYWARYCRIPVIDATSVITAIHQNHDYGHHPAGAAGVWKGPESIRNVMLMGGWERGLTIADATLRLTPDGLKTPLSPRYLYHRLRAVAVLSRRWHLLMAPLRITEQALGLAARLLARWRR